MRISADNPHPIESLFQLDPLSVTATCQFNGCKNSMHIQCNYQMVVRHVEYILGAYWTKTTTHLTIT